MFFEHSVEIDRRFGDLLDVIEEPAATWLIPLADGDAAGSGPRMEPLRTSLRTGRRFPLHKAVWLHIGRLHLNVASASLAIRIEAVNGRALFPELDADLTIVARGSKTRVTLRGVYRPPLNTTGEAIDGLLLSRVAQRGLRDLTERLAAALDEAVAPSALPA